MAYTPNTWVNDVTALNATRMNHIETGIDDVDQALADHLADTADAHDASAISVADSGGFYTGTDVEAVLQELGGKPLFHAYACYQDQKTAGTAGGSSSTGSWLTRTLNTEVFDPSGIGSLSSNAVTLAAGTYRLEAWSSFGVAGNVSSLVQIRIRNTAGGGSTVATSAAQKPGASSGVVDDSAICHVVGRLVAAGTATIEVQYQMGSAVTTNGLGWAANFGETEVYTTLMVYREA